MLFPIEVWFPAFKFAASFGVVAIIVDSLLQPRPKRKASPPPAATDTAVGYKDAA